MSSEPTAYNLAAIRELLLAAFTAGDLRRFCQDRPMFRPILSDFGPKQNLHDMVDTVVDFCMKMFLWEELLAEVAAYNPKQYSRFAAQQGRPEETGTGSPIPSDSAPGLPPLPFAPERLYSDVDIHVERKIGDRYPVSIRTSSAGVSQGSLVLLRTPEEMGQFLIHLERGEGNRHILENMGRSLFRALFGPPLGNHFAMVWSRSETGLRLRLWFEAPELQTLPWELLYDDERDEFLALRGILIARYLSVPRTIPPLAADPPLRILVVTASPGDQPSLDVDGEAEILQSALSSLVMGGMAEISIVHHAQAWTLRDALWDFRPHVLHFVGHSRVDSHGGALILENEAGSSAPLSGSMFAMLLKRSDVRLVVLNAPLSASRAAGEAEPFDDRRSALLDVGPALVAAGVGAVVVSQFALSHKGAQLFAHEFYNSVARFEAVDEAVARAREWLALEVGRDQRDWAAPVLFMRAPDGVLFLGPETR